jgi:hypothetical protein
MYTRTLASNKSVDYAHWIYTRTITSNTRVNLSAIGYMHGKHSQIRDLTRRTWVFTWNLPSNTRVDLLRFGLYTDNHLNYSW